MKKKLTILPFSGTPEQEKALQAVFAEYKDVKGALLPVMQKAQGIYGYLPIEVQRMIADGMDVSLEEVYGVATFYSQFLLTKKGENSISVCLGTACYVKGAGAILEEIEKELGVKSGETTKDGRFSLEATRCIGACGLAPVMTVNDDVYGRLTKEEIPSILKKYN